MFLSHSELSSLLQQIEKFSCDTAEARSSLEYVQLSLDNHKVTPLGYQVSEIHLVSHIAPHFTLS